MALGSCYIKLFIAWLKRARQAYPSSLSLLTVIICGPAPALITDRWFWSG